MKKLKVNKQEFIIIFIIFFLMLLLNLITPMIMDDFYYSYGLNGRISSFKEILDFQVWHYLYWGGRTIAHTLVQFFLMSHKIIFDFFNSFIVYPVLSDGLESRQWASTTCLAARSGTLVRHSGRSLQQLVCHH